MANDVSLTAARLRIEQEEEERRVRASAALYLERAAAIARFALFSSLGIVSHFIGREHSASELRIAFIVPYGVFVITSAILMYRRREANIRAASIFGFITPLFDNAFILGMSYVDSVEGVHDAPVLITGLIATMLVFTVGRYLAAQTAYATVLAIGTQFASLALLHAITAAQVGFGAVCYLTIGGMLLYNQRRWQLSALELRRRENLAHFLPRQVVDRVMRSGGTALQPVQREVTILFSDIRDFTSLSEKQAPRDVLRFLDEYFAHMSTIVKGHEGLLNKFLGDGLLAVWGVPDAQDDHAARALKAALDMRKSVAELNAQRARNGEQPFRIGIGVHSGPVAAGMLGGADQHEYTVIGDAVNLASRIEGLNKTFGTDVLASERTWALAGERFAGERVGEEKVKGREMPVVVYAVRDTRAA